MKSNDIWAHDAFRTRMQRGPSRLPPLDLLPGFEAAARTLSFTRAAAERFVTQSAISRQIAALESHLGVALFVRRHRALELTADGERLATATRRALGLLHETVDALRAGPRREVLALTTTPGLASLWLIPRLADFLAAHPGVDVRVDATHEARRLGADGFDLAIRYAPADRAVGDRLFGETMQLVCSPALLRDRHRPLRVPADLARHTLLQANATLGAGLPVEWQSWLGSVGLDELVPAAVLSFSSFDAAVAAAVAGQGVLLGRRPLIDGLLARGDLVAPLETQGLDSSFGYTVLVEPAAARREAVQALRRWLLEQAESARPGITMNRRRPQRAAPPPSNPK